MRILVVENDESEFSLFEERVRAELEAPHPELTLVCTLAEGVSAAQHGGFDVVLLDLELDETEGLATVNTFFELAHGLIPPIVVMTAHDDSDLAALVLRAGAYGYVTKGEMSSKTLMRLLLAAVERDRAFRELADAHRDAHHQATHCSLTDLPNRLLFEDRLEQAIALCTREARAMALLYIDLDGFKRVNDRLGHAVGDSLLREVARRIQIQTRATDTIARIGGDEFALLLSEVRESAGPGLVAEKIRSALAEPCTIGGYRITVGSSIGIAVFPYDGVASRELSRAADEAMYVAKQARDGYHYATPGVEYMGVVPAPARNTKSSANDLAAAWAFPEAAPGATAPTSSPPSAMMPPREPEPGIDS